MKTGLQRESDIALGSGRCRRLGAAEYAHGLPLRDRERKRGDVDLFCNEKGELVKGGK